MKTAMTPEATAGFVAAPITKAAAKAEDVATKVLLELGNDLSAQNRGEAPLTRVSWGNFFEKTPASAWQLL
jgi:hypothetical protein